MDVKKELTRADIERIETNALRRYEGVYQQAIIASQKLRGFTDQMAEAVKKRIESAQKNWSNAIANNNNHSSWVEATDQLRAECCALLRQVKQINGGTLPSEWYELSADMRCD